MFGNPLKPDMDANFEEMTAYLGIDQRVSFLRDRTRGRKGYNLKQLKKHVMDDSNLSLFTGSSEELNSFGNGGSGSTRRFPERSILQKNSAMQNEWKVAHLMFLHVTRYRKLRSGTYSNWFGEMEHF